MYIFPLIVKAYMGTSISNWIHNKCSVAEKDRQALEKAKKLEAKQEKSGYRWVKVNERNKVFVPCDKKGKPTKEGLRKIELFKMALE